MSTDPEILPGADLPEGSYLQPQPFSVRSIPNFGDLALFLAVAVGLLFLTEFVTFSLAIGLRLFGKETAAQLLREPRLLIPTMAISYLIAGALAWAIFSNLWQQPFLSGIHWNFLGVRGRGSLFVAIGVLVSIAVQLLSNYLPIPKTLPIDEFFRTPADVWLVAIFGVFVAPVFEELAFRGFMLPSLATAWDWMTRRTVQRPGGKTRWSTGALFFSCIVTSVAFALLHSDQLAHAWAPLAVLFCVSLVLCLMRLWAHSLCASVLVHASYNATIFALLFYASDGFRHLDKINR